jgi:DNA-binding beta-propeller fold protein YncE
MTTTGGHLKRQWKRAFSILLSLGVLGAVGVSAQIAGGAPGQRRNKDHSPIAISAFRSGTVIVLEASGGLSTISPGSSRRTPVKASLGSFSPVDMTAVHIGEQDSLLVTMYWAFSSQSAQGNEGVVEQYSPQGEEQHQWSQLGHTFAGIAADGDRQTIYLGSSNTADISTLSMMEKSPPKATMHVSGASMIGPMALDTAGQRLFAADLGAGKIYVVDLASGKSRQLASGLGEPAALSYDGSQHKLYIADAARHRVSQILVDTPGAKTADFFASGELHEPRGVTVAPDHSVWVADFVSGVVMQLSAAGKVVAKVQP